MKKLSSDLVFYGLLDLLQRSLGIVLVPVYTRVLSQANYGNLDLIFTASSAMLVLVDLQFTSGFARFYLEHQKKGNGPRFAGTVILTRLAFGGALVASLLTLGYGGFLEVSFLPGFLANSTAWTAMALGIPVTLTYDILVLQAQMERSKKWFFLGTITNTLFSVLLCLLFTVLLGWGVLGVALGQTLGTLTATLLLLAGRWKEISFSYQVAIFKELIRYTLPLIPGWWMGFTTAYVSRFFIYGSQGSAQSAILAITAKMAGVLALFGIAFRTAWQPLAMSYVGDEEGCTFYVKSLRFFIVAGIFSIFCLTVLSRPMLALLAPKSYVEAENYIPLFLVGSLLCHLEVNLQLGNQIAKKTYWMSVGSLFEFAINLLVLSVFTARFGIWAAGGGMIASALAKVLITYYSAQKSHYIGYDRRSLTVFFVGCLLLLVLSWARSCHMVGDFSFFTVATVLGIMLPWYALGPAERQLIRGQLGNFDSSAS